MKLSRKNIRGLYRKWRQRRGLRLNGFRELSNAVDALRESGANVWLDFGTLLGFTRDGCFVTGDRDIDLGVPYEPGIVSQYIGALSKYGFRLKRMIRLTELENREVELSFVKRGVSLDLFLYSEDSMQNHRYCFTFSAPRGDTLRRAAYNKTIILLKHYMLYKPTTVISINGVELPIPSDPEQYLEFHYGPEWRIPNPRWDYVTDSLNTVRYEGIGVRIMDVD